jgi:very-short-patch-repair endonuclease
MTIHYNKESEKTNRRKLRINSTQSEEILWEYLRNRKLLRLKFKRQYSIDHFVVDFFCSEIKLAIELDGEIHLSKDVKNHDENRDSYLRSFGIRILRIKNEKVLNDIKGTLELIKNNIATLRQASPETSNPTRFGS